MVKSVISITLAATFAFAGRVSAADEAVALNEIASKENAFYRMATIPTPAGVQFEAGALQFIGSDKLAVATRIGEIWIGEGLLGDAPPKWTLFERGLHEVLGLAWRALSFSYADSRSTL